MRGRSGDAFSLIELLVVLLIIGILAGLLLPALNRARQSADGALCRSNLRQQGIGLSLYVDDFGVYPRLYSGTYWFIALGKFWVQALEPHVGQKWPGDNVVEDATGGVVGRVRTNGGGGVFACPGYGRVGGGYFHAGELQGLVGGSGAYAYNATDGFVSDRFGFGGAPLDEKFTNLAQLRPIRADEVLNPSGMITLGDSAIEASEADSPCSLGATMAPWGDRGARSGTSGSRFLRRVLVPLAVVGWGAEDAVFGGCVGPWTRISPSFAS